MTLPTRLLRRRLIRAFTTVPDAAAWRDTAIIYAGFLVLAVPLAALRGLVVPVATQLEPLEVLRLAGRALIVPSLFEELLYRVLLNPHRSEHRFESRRWFWGGVSIALYVASHPVGTWLLRPWASGVLAAPDFLLIVGLLGGATLLAYWRSGSLWPPLVLHWLTVVGWLLLGGGELLAPSAGPG